MYLFVSQQSVYLKDNVIVTEKTRHSVAHRSHYRDYSEPTVGVALRGRPCVDLIEGGHGGPPLQYVPSSLGNGIDEQRSVLFFPSR